LKDYLYQVLFFCGYHELDVDWICARLLKRGDVFVDIGACYGYHALTNACRVGPEGRVFAFEPQPDVFAALRENTLLNGLANIELENFALSDRTECLQLHRFSDLGVGHTSIAALPGRTVSREISCDASTLDDYIARKGIGRVMLVKLDVEGAELKVLMGARGLLSTPVPPMWILEANETTARACGYRTRDLLCLLAEFGYRAYRVVWGYVPRRIRRIEPCPEGVGFNQNLLCLIPSVHGSALARAAAA
jgi:FkbM family methyltransferase